jgi:hypothetical protein
MSKCKAVLDGGKIGSLRVKTKSDTVKPSHQGKVEQKSAETPKQS